MIEHGIRLTCDRCSETVFLRYLKTEKEVREWQTDKVHNIYEDAHKGWQLIDKSAIALDINAYVDNEWYNYKLSERSLLCPTCAEERGLLLKEFMEVHP